VKRGSYGQGNLLVNAWKARNAATRLYAVLEVGGNPPGGQNGQIIVLRNQIILNGLALDIQLSAGALPLLLNRAQHASQKGGFMFRRSLAVLLLAAHAAAQLPVRPTKDPTMQSLNIYRRYYTLRLGTSEDVLFILEPGNGNKTGLTIASLRLDAPAQGGLTVSDIRYPEARANRALPGKPLTLTATPAGDYRIRFKVHAARDAAGPLTTLKGTLHYQLADQSGIHAPQKIDLAMGFTLVPEHAKTYRTPWPFEGFTKAQLVGIALVMIPLYFPAMIVCVAVNGADGCTC
jgi:hypothetical protein